MASAHPVHPQPNTLEAAVMIRSGLRREVAITPLKSLWTFLLAWTLLLLRERAEPSQALGWREELRLVGKWRAAGVGIDCVYRQGNGAQDTGNLLRFTLVEGGCPTVSDGKVGALSALLAASPKGQHPKFSFVQRGREEEFSLPGS